MTRALRALRYSTVPTSFCGFWPLRSPLAVDFIYTKQDRKCVQTNLNSLAVTQTCHCGLAKRRLWVPPEDGLYYGDHRLDSGLEPGQGAHVELWTEPRARNWCFVRASCQSTLPRSPGARKPMRSVVQT